MVNFALLLNVFVSKLAAAVSLVAKNTNIAV
jgi:hypothetical protein